MKPSKPVPPFNPKEVTKFAVERFIEILATATDVNVRGKDGRTAVFNAARTGRDKHLELLLKRGAKPDIPNENDETPLLVAAEGGHLRCVELLLDAGAEIDRRLDPNNHYDSMSALFRAVRGGQREIVEVLLARGANPKIGSARGYLPLNEAASVGDTAACYILIKAGAELERKDKGGTPLARALGFGHLVCAEALLELGANPNSKEWPPPLFAAIASDDNSVEMVRALIKAGARVNPGSPNAVEEVETDDRGAPSDGESEDEDGSDDDNCDSANDSFARTPLGEALSRGNVDCAKVLLEAGADPNVGSDGIHPLGIAIQFEESLATMTMLVRAGANLNGERDHGAYVIETARGVGNKVAEKLLRSLGAKAVDDPDVKAVRDRVVARAKAENKIRRDAIDLVERLKEVPCGLLARHGWKNSPGHWEFLKEVRSGGVPDKTDDGSLFLGESYGAAGLRFLELGLVVIVPGAKDLAPRKYRLTEAGEAVLNAFALADETCEAASTVFDELVASAVSGNVEQTLLLFMDMSAALGVKDSRDLTWIDAAQTVVTLKGEWPNAVAREEDKPTLRAMACLWGFGLLDERDPKWKLGREVEWPTTTENGKERVLEKAEFAKLIIPEFLLPRC